MRRVFFAALAIWILMINGACAEENTVLPQAVAQDWAARTGGMERLLSSVQPDDRHLVVLAAEYEYAACLLCYEKDGEGWRFAGRNRTFFMPSIGEGVQATLENGAQLLLLDSETEPGAAFTLRCASDGVTTMEIAFVLTPPELMDNPAVGDETGWHAAQIRKMQSGGEWITVRMFAEPSFSYNMRENMPRTVLEQGGWCLGVREFYTGHQTGLLGNSHIWEDWHGEAPAFPEPGYFDEMTLFINEWDSYRDVYSGPGEAYLRGARGRASVSIEQAFTVLGKSEGWLMVLYVIDKDQWRVGYIDPTGHAALELAAQLTDEIAFERREGYTTEKKIRLYDDPEHAKEQLGWIAAGQPVTVLREMDAWLYVETQIDGKPCRGFVKRGALAL